MSDAEIPRFEDGTRYDGWVLLGRGALGQTWMARDTLLDQKVIIKVRPESPANLVNAHREVQAVKLLNSQYLQRSFDLRKSQQGQLGLFYEYVDGPTLQDQLALGASLADRDALLVARDVLDGLRVAHENGVVHRDVSPANIVLADRGAVLIDFNALGTLTEDSAMGRTTLAGEFAGKPLYMSPEQMVGAPQTAAVDIWGLGAVLYEAVTGRAFRTGASIADLVSAQSEDPDVSAAPQPMRPLLQGLLAADPVARPDAAEALRLIDELISGAGPVMGMPPAQQTGVRVRAPGLPPPAPRKTKSGGRLAVVFLALTGALLTLALVLYFSGLFSGSTGDSSGPGPFPEMSPALLLNIGFVIVGVILVVSSFFIAGFVRTKAAESDVALPFKTLDLINAPDARDRLTETICLRIDAYRELAGKQAEDMLSVTMVALANEYAVADTADERFQALTMLNDLHTRVARTLRPWWMNYETLIARALSLTTLVAGVVAAVEGVRRLF